MILSQNDVILNKKLTKDTVPPTIISETIAARTYILGDEINLKLKFSEKVFIEGSPRMELILTERSEDNLYANLISGSGTDELVFTYTIKEGDASNGITLGELTEGRVSDRSGNDASRTLVGSDLSGVIVHSDQAKIISFNEPTNGTYGLNGELLFQINFSENVTVSGLPQIEIKIDEASVWAQYKSGSGSSGLEFSYTIQADQNDTDGIEILSNSIDLNSGEIRSAADNYQSALGFSTFKDPTTSVLVNTALNITPASKVQGVTTAPTTSNTTLSCSWATPNNNGTQIIDYSVQYRPLGDSTWQNVSPNPTTSQVNVPNLDAGITYEFRVAANNGILGEYSDTSTAKIFDVSALNPIAWLSATNVTNGGAQPAHNEKISSWADLTGSAQNAVEPETLRQPTFETNVFNGLPAVRFNGEAQGLRGTFERTNNAGLTIFVVGKMDTNNRRECFFEFFSTTASRRGFFFNYGFNEATTNFNLDDTTFNLWSAYDDGNKTDFYENDQTIYIDRNNWGSGQSTSFVGSGAYILGDDQTGGDALHGYIGEFLIFDKELNVQETQALKTYLKNKWGTP